MKRRPRIWPAVLIPCLLLPLTIVTVVGARNAVEPTAAESPATGRATAGDAEPVESPPPARLVVNVVDLRNREGQLVFGVFSAPKGFPMDSRRAVSWQVRETRSNSARFEAQLPPGDYAASVLHDENANNKMDQNLIGVPKEGYGVTNNPKPRFRAANFKEAVFTLPPEGAEVTISLQYF